MHTKCNTIAALLSTEQRISVKWVLCTVHYAFPKQHLGPFSQLKCEHMFIAQDKFYYANGKKGGEEGMIFSYSGKNDVHCTGDLTIQNGFEIVFYILQLQR